MQFLLIRPEPTPFILHNGLKIQETFSFDGLCLPICRLTSFPFCLKGAKLLPAKEPDRHHTNFIENE
jgi:hypothetical protein